MPELSVRSSRVLLPGLLLVTGLCAGAYLLASLPGLRYVGALGLALVLGIGFRAALGLPASARPGASFAARTLLRVGVALLGVRLNLALLPTAGPAVLGLVSLAVVVGIVVVERLGKLAGLSRGLRWSLAFGSGVCGASAAVAAATLAGSTDDEVSVAVGTVSLVGTLGALGYTLAGAAAGLSPERYGMMTGSTLQEVGQVLAAGFALGPEAGDLATLVKLARVALLAPALVIAGLILRGRGGSVAGRPAALLPWFLVAFVLIGLVASTGIVPAAVLAMAGTASVWLAAAAMAGIGLGVDLATVRRAGGPALLVGSAGFGALVAMALAYTGMLGV